MSNLCVRRAGRRHRTAGGCAVPASAGPPSTPATAGSAGAVVVVPRTADPAVRPDSRLLQCGANLDQDISGSERGTRELTSARGTNRGQLTVLGHRHAPAERRRASWISSRRTPWRPATRRCICGRPPQNPSLRQHPPINRAPLRPRSCSPSPGAPASAGMALQMRGTIPAPLPGD